MKRYILIKTYVLCSWQWPFLGLGETAYYKRLQAIASEAQLAHKRRREAR